jgi:hypothetical protein
VAIPRRRRRNGLGTGHGIGEVLAATNDLPPDGLLGALRDAKASILSGGRS